MLQVYPVCFFIPLLRLISSDSEAKESVYTKFGNMEIMFHVSTLLPNNPNDQQKAPFFLD